MMKLRILLLFTALMGPKLQACSVCMGASDGLTASAANGAIFLMLGFVGTILAAIASFVIYLARRARSNPGIDRHGFTNLHGERKHA